MEKQELLIDSILILMLQLYFSSCRFVEVGGKYLVLIIHNFRGLINQTINAMLKNVNQAFSKPVSSYFTFQNTVQDNYAMI